MLNIINNMEPFFEDCYRRISVREYARLIKTSPPTASKLLNACTAKSLLQKQKFRNYILYHANRESKDFIDLSRIYWRHKLKDIISVMEKELTLPAIILFGSLSKAETKKDSDIDIAVFAHKKRLDTDVFEKNLKRKVQIFWIRSIKDIKSKELANNILNGYILTGRIVLWQ